MKSTLMAAAISGMVIGAAGLAHASTSTNNTISSIDSAAQQLDDSAGKHSCKGKNACKGHGVSMMSKSKCTKKGGTVQS